MRLWSVNPGLLDRRALVACWREALLAQKVLAGQTRGYTRHPQLIRFRASEEPAGVIAAYLDGLANEAASRGYHFNRELIIAKPGQEYLTVTTGQLIYEWQHLCAKVAARDNDWFEYIRDIDTPLPHPLFRLVDGHVADWERATPL